MTGGADMRTSERGMTLLEVLLVIGLMGLLLVLGSYTVRAVTKSALRAGTNEIAAALRAAANLSAQSGVHHRVLVNLDQQTYQIEACPDPVRMRREDSEEERPDQEALARLSAQPNPLGAAAATAAAGLGTGLDEVSGAESPEKAIKAAAALAGVRVGTARCGLAPASGGDAGNFRDAKLPSVHKLSGDDGVGVRRVHVQHLRDPVTKGEVSIHFFPLGQAEKAMIELADTEGDQFTVLLFGLTGRVEVRDGEADPDVHMRRDAAGDEVDEP